MKHFLRVIGFVAAFGLGVWLGWPTAVSAQGVAPNGTSIGFNATNNSPCQTPAPGINALCFTVPTTANPTGILASTNGSAYGALGGGGSIPGPKGDPGAAATVTVGNTSTGASGTLASVTNSGTPSAAVLNFTIPQGPPGPAGAVQTTFTCDISIAVGGKATLSGCK